jgi:hypothetical protein
LCQRLETHFESAIIFFARETEKGRPRLEHLICANFAVPQVQDRVEVSNPVFGKDIAFFRERRLHYFRSSRHGGTGIRARKIHQMRMKDVVHRERNRVQWFLVVLGGEQIVDVSDADLGGIAGIDRAAARARAVQLRRGVVGVKDVFSFDTEASKYALNNGAYV